MLENIAPVAPDATLLALERSIAKANDDEARRYGTHYIQILGSLAYEAALFDRSVALLVRLGIADDEKRNNSHAKHRLEILFQLHVSGTLAPLDQRLRVIESLLKCSDARYRDIAVSLVRAGLEAWQFDTAGPVEFGARLRDYGYRPKTVGDVQQWYRQVMQLARAVAIGQGTNAEPIRVALASAFRGLWSRGCVHEELDELCRAIAARQFWPDGWRAIRQVLRYDVKASKSRLATRLRKLEQALRPRDLVEQAKAVVLPSSMMYSLDTIDGSDEDAAVDQAYSLARNLGSSVAGDSEALETLIPDLVIGNGLRWYFGEGLADGAQDAQSTWNLLTAGFAEARENDRRSLVLQGFLHGLHRRDAKHTSAILDQALSDPVLGAWFPVLQAAVPIGRDGAARLARALKIGKARAHMYEALAYKRATDSMPAKALVSLLRGIGALENGLHASMEILYMRFFTDADQKKQHHPALIAFGQDLLAQMPFAKKNTQEDHRLGQIGKACLKGKSGAHLVEKLCRNLRAAVSKRETSAGYHDHLLLALAGAQPIAVLNGLLGGGSKTREQGIRLLLELQNFRQNPVDQITPDNVIAWCKREPKVRYAAVARVITVSSRPIETGPLEWSPTARLLLKHAPDRLIVLKHLVLQFGPLWIGTDIPAFEAQVKLLEELITDPDTAVPIFATEEAARLREGIVEVKRREALNARQRDERFE